VLSRPPASPTSGADKARRGTPPRSIIATTYILIEYQDYPYLSPIIKEIEAEKRERMDLDAMVVKKPASRS